MGDKNAVMVASRILAYGPEYETDITNPSTGDSFRHTFNLADCPFKKLPEGVKGNSFELELPISKRKVTYKILTGKEENEITKELKQMSKLGSSVSPELTTRLRYSIISVDGETDKSIITNFSQNMLARDSIFLRLFNSFNSDINSFNNIYVISVGKASILMYSGVQQILDSKINRGLIISPFSSDVTFKNAEIFISDHPIPSKKSILASNKIYITTSSGHLIICSASSGEEISSKKRNLQGW